MVKQMNMTNNAAIKAGLARQAGFSIMEILIAIVIFAIGMMALASASRSARVSR